MEKLIYTIASSDRDLLDILNLQQANLPKTISKSEALDQGFVTFKHWYAYRSVIHALQELRMQNVLSAML